MTPLILRDEAIAHRPEDGGRIAAMVAHSNPLASGARLPEKLLAPALVSWSGWSPSFDGLPTHAPIDFAIWSRSAWDELARWCDGLEAQLRERNIQVWMRPHARHVLADPQACVSFLARRAGERFKLLLEPSAFLTPDMLGRAEDHLTRAFEALGGHAGTVAVLLTNLARVVPADAPLQASPLHQGMLDVQLLVGLWRRYVPSTVPVVLMAEFFAHQLESISRE